MSIRALFTYLMILFAGHTAAQQTVLVNDPAVRTGKLPNGLTYYIRHNSWPANRANFYIAQKVGALQEEDHQRGLAHFLEHMCFNGSDNFKPNDLVRYCESIGVQYGSDLNAYTGIEETVYNINNVPTTRTTTLDSCLLILRDWAGGLTLSTEEIDQERGVIYEEWRQNLNARQRIMERALPVLYGGVRYGERMPIGLMSVVMNFKPKALRDYYEKWYRPENQAIIVVGDIDVDAMEARIKQRFSTLKGKTAYTPITPITIADNEQPIIVIEKDVEQTTNQVDLIFKYDPSPVAAKQTTEHIKQRYLKTAASALVNARLGEAAQKNDCPFFGAQMGDGQYLVSKTKRAFFISLAAKGGQTLQSLQAAYAETLRAKRHGFTAGEFERFKANSLSSLERMYANRDKRSNDQLAEDLKFHFIDHEPYLAAEQQYQLMKQIITATTLDDLNRTIQSMVPEEDRNMVVLSLNNEAEGNIYPTQEGILRAIHAARAMTLQPYVDQVNNEPLIAKLPTPGKIVKTQKSKKFDYDILTLSNGIKVYLKHTGHDKKSISLTGECAGGTGIYGLEDRPNFRLFNSVIGASRLGALTRNELAKRLAGSVANAGLSIDEQRVYVTGSTTPKDLETMFQLVYLNLTDIRKDEATFERILRKQYADLQADALSVEKAFSDSVTATFYGHNPRLRPFGFEDFNTVDLDRILQMAKEQTAAPGAFEFTIIGNYEMDSIRPLLERYLASLPAHKETKAGARTSILQKGRVANHFTRPMDTPKAQTVTMWHSDALPYTQKNVLVADVAGQILSMIYMDKIREKGSAAYSVGARAAMQRHQDGTATATITVDCPVRPEKADWARSVILQEVDSLAITCDAAMLDKVKQIMLKQSDDLVHTNGYWSTVVQLHRKYNLDWHTQRKAIISALKPADVSAFVRAILKSGNRTEVSMAPQP